MKPIIPIYSHYCIEGRRKQASEIAILGNARIVTHLNLDQQYSFGYQNGSNNCDKKFHL